jgi:sirohydrochlorin ferrochelatase
MKSVGMPEYNKFSLCNFDQAILFVGHGSSSQPMSGEISLEYGQYMSSRRHLRKIEVGAILSNPTLINALQTLKGNVRVLPVMMSNRHLVPDSINELVGRDDEFPSPFQLSFLDPVGEAEEISSIAYSVAQDAAADRGWDI